MRRLRSVSLFDPAAGAGLNPHWTGRPLERLTGASSFERLGRTSWSFIGIVAAVAVVCGLLSLFRLAALPAAYGLLLAALLSPVADGLRRLKFPRLFVATLSLLLALAIFGGLGTIFGVSVASEISQLKASVAEGYTSLVNWVADAASIPREELNVRVRDHVEQGKDSLASLNNKTVTRLAGVMQGVTIAGMSLIFAWFFTWDGDRQFKGAVGLLPQRHQKDLCAIGDRIWKALTAYVQGVVIVATADALLLGLGLWIIGVPLIVPLMLLMFLAAFVPYVGPMIAGVAAGLVGLSEGGISTAALAILVSFLVQQVEGGLLQPFIMSRAVELHPLLVLTVLTIGGIIGGVAGVLLAVPVAASFKTTILYLHERTHLVGVDEHNRLTSAQP